MLSFLSYSNSQCSIDPVPVSTLLPLGIEGNAFQLNSAAANPLPYTVAWTVSGGSLVFEDPSMGAALFDFPEAGIYNICATATYDDGTPMCMVCIDFDYQGPTGGNPCGDAGINASAVADTTGFYEVMAFNTDSVDAATVSWDPDTGYVLNEDPATLSATIEFPSTGIYTVCMNYLSLSGDACSACMDINYSDIPTESCLVQMEYGVLDEATYDYGVLAQFSEGVDYNTLVWDAFGAGVVTTGVLLPGNPELVQVTFNGPGIYPVCVTVTSLDGDVCQECIDVEVTDAPPVNCTSGFSAGQISQPGMFWSFSYDGNTDFMDLSTFQWDLGGGTLPDPNASLNDLSITAEFPTEGTYVVCLNVTDLNGDDCSTCYNIIAANYDPAPCTMQVYGEAANPANYEYYFAADIQGEVDFNSIVWDFGGGVGAIDPIGIGSNYSFVTFPEPGDYTVCVTATGADGNPCSACYDVMVEEYVPEPCTVTVTSNANNPAAYIYDFYANPGGDIDTSEPLTWTYTGGANIGLNTNDNWLQLQFPGAGTYDVCVTGVGLDGGNCTHCETIVIAEYVPQPCSVVLNYFITSNSDYTASVYAEFNGDVDWTTITWDLGGGVDYLFGDPTGNNLVDIQFPGEGVYTVCATATGLDGVDCSSCVDVLIDSSSNIPCDAGYWYYEDPATGTYFFEAFANNGQAPYTYEWIIPELGVVVSNDQSFSTDSIPDGLFFSLCVTITDATGDVCEYCEPIGDNVIYPPLPPGDGCLDWNVIDLTATCPEIYDPVCGCDGITYENACIAEQCFGVVAYVQGPCPGYVDPTVPTQPEDCTGEFFYFGQPDGDGGVDLFFFGFGNNADDFVWDMGDGTIINGPDAFLSIDSLDALSSYTVCMTTVSYWDTCSVTVCETIVLDPDPTGWIEGYVFDNSDEIGGGNGQGEVERVMSSNGEPLPGAIIELVDWNGNVLESVVTDVDGKYSFTQLYFGDFHIHVNIDGATHVPYLVSISPTSQFANEINFELRQDGEVVLGTDELDWATNVMLLPNPTKGDVSLSMNLTKNAEIQIVVSDMTGRNISSQSYSTTQGIFTESLDLNGLASGVYLVSIVSGNEVLTRKVVKQ